MSIISRILEIIEYKNLNKSRFYKETGLSNGFLDKVKDIGSSKIENILKTYPDINSYWLITGIGEMLLTNTSDAEIDLDFNSNKVDKLDILKTIKHLLDNDDVYMSDKDFKAYLRSKAKQILATEEIQANIDAKMEELKALMKDKISEK